MKLVYTNKVHSSGFVKKNSENLYNKVYQGSGMVSIQGNPVGTLRRILIEKGYIEDGIYYFYVREAAQTPFYQPQSSCNTF